jgi:uncharacterized protein (TIGR01244 family)
MAANFIQLAEGFYVSPQLTPDDIAEAVDLGVALIINNRPDGEEPGQPAGAEIEAAARAAGVGYVAIPISGMGINEAGLDAFDKAITGSAGPILAFCRSGTRSTMLRAFANARAGVEADDIIEEARRAGYGIAGQLQALRSFAKR